jgi:hypothetical protein
MAMRSRSVVLGLLVALACARPASGQTAAERDAGRALVTTSGDAVVMVLATIKARIVVNGREQTRDTPLQANALVIASNGLTILPLSTLDPGDLLTRTLTAQGGANAKVDVSSETSELRIRIGGKEVPATVVLRDGDLDVVYLRPTEPLPSPVTAAETDGPLPKLLDTLIAVQRATEAYNWGTLASFAVVQLVIEKPRPYLLASLSTIVGNGLGAAMFDTSGRFIGIVTRIAGIAGSGDRLV